MSHTMGPLEVGIADGVGRRRSLRGSSSSPGPFLLAASGVPTSHNNQMCPQARTDVPWDSPHCCRMCSQFSPEEGAMRPPG